MKKVVAMILAMMMVVSLCACGAGEGTSAGTPEASGTPGGNPGVVSGIYENREKGITAIYHSTYHDQLVDGIEKIVSPYVLLRTDGQYSNSIWGDAKALPSTPVRFFEGGDDLAFWGEDGKFHVRRKMLDGEAAFGLAYDGALVHYAFTEHGVAYFFSYRDGNLYFCSADDDGGDCGTESQAYVAYYDGYDYKIDSGKIAKYVFDGLSVTLWMENGTCYQCYFTGTTLSSILNIENSDTPTGERVSVIAMDRTETEFDQIYDCVSNKHFLSPVYSKVGDQRHVYYVDYIDSEEAEVSIALPAGYTTADIQNLQIEQHIFVEFKDGGVYYLEQEAMSNLTMENLPLSLQCHEGLSELGRAGHLRGIVIMDLGCKAIALLDDGCMYRVDAR
ncbi:MAG: hypothetical protein IKU26_04725 [Clostridia bacterium]|nr:hypothetical protein [Clostridia bacterium]